MADSKKDAKKASKRGGSSRAAQSRKTTRAPKDSAKAATEGAASAKSTKPASGARAASKQAETSKSEPTGSGSTERVGEALSSAVDAVTEAAESFADVSDAAAAKKANESETRLVHIAYLLFALTPIMGVTCIAGLMLAYGRRNTSGVAKTVVESHYNWLIWTFWYGLAAYIISGVLILVFVGWLLIVLTSIWLVWRITKGWLTHYDGKAMAKPMAAL